MKGAPASRLHRAVDDYLTLRRTLGFKLFHETWWLPDFATFLKRQRRSVITVDLALQWAMLPTGVDRSWWGRRLGSVRQFAKHHRATDPRTEIPPPDLIPFRTPRRAPYLYSPQEVGALMRAAAKLPQPILAASYATLIGLLAATGMRVSEALNLDDADIAYTRGAIVVRGAKFNKTREVPVDATTLTALRTFMRRRNRLRIDYRSSCLFVSTTGARVGYTNFGNTFRRLLRAVGIQHKPSPRIHDLRHSFAVTTLCDWYRSGVEVDPRMPLLSTYLGHVSPNTTYWYLKATPQLVGLAAKRLERAWEQRS